jgi:hypothetical protein
MMAEVVQAQLPASGAFLLIYHFQYVKVSLLQASIRVVDCLQPQNVGKPLLGSTGTQLLDHVNRQHWLGSSSLQHTADWFLLSFFHLFIL